MDDIDALLNDLSKSCVSRMGLLCLDVTRVR